MNNLQVLMNGVFGRKVPAEFAAENYDLDNCMYFSTSRNLFQSFSSTTL